MFLLASLRIIRSHQIFYYQHFRIRRLFVSALWYFPSRTVFVVCIIHCNRQIFIYYFSRLPHIIRFFRHYCIICRRICRFLWVRMLSCFWWSFYLFVTHRPVIYINYSVRVLFSVANFKKPPGCHSMCSINFNICGFQFRFLIYFFVNLHSNLCWTYINITIVCFTH